MPLSSRFALHVCHHCGRVVARQPCYHTGKGSVRHKCPHGRWCSSASALTATCNRPKCPDCRAAIVAAEKLGQKPWAKERAGFKLVEAAAKDTVKLLFWKKGLGKGTRV